MAASPAPLYEPKRWYPWWIDPISDNPIAFGVLFLLLIAILIGGLLLARFLLVPSDHPGSHPIGPPSVLFGTVRACAAYLLG
jgi:hypothetical protein